MVRRPILGRPWGQCSYIIRSGPSHAIIQNLCLRGIVHSWRGAFWRPQIVQNRADIRLSEPIWGVILIIDKLLWRVPVRYHSSWISLNCIDPLLVVYYPCILAHHWRVFPLNVNVFVNFFHLLLTFFLRTKCVKLLQILLNEIVLLSFWRRPPQVAFRALSWPHTAVRIASASPAIGPGVAVVGSILLSWTFDSDWLGRVSELLVVLPPLATCCGRVMLSVGVVVLSCPFETSHSVFQFFVYFHVFFD